MKLPQLRDSSRNPEAFPNSPKISIFTSFNRKIPKSLSGNPLNINLRFSRKSGLYRYSFNGKESDSEASDLGEGTQDYGFRIYNPSLGKFLSVDPLTHKFAFYTPYQFAGNKPIVAIDLDGLEDVWTHTFKEADGSLYTITMACTDEGFEDFKNNLIATMNIPLSEIPASGEFVSICETDSEGNKNCSWVNGLPTVVVSDASLGESFGTRFTNGLMAITGGLNELGSPEYGYEYEGLVQSADISIKAQGEFLWFKGEFNAGLFSTDESNVGCFFSANFGIGPNAKMSSGGKVIETNLSFVPKYSLEGALNLHSTNKFIPSDEFKMATKYSQETRGTFRNVFLGLKREMDENGNKNSTLSIGYKFGKNGRDAYSRKDSMTSSATRTYQSSTIELE